MCAYTDIFLKAFMIITIVFTYIKQKIIGSLRNRSIAVASAGAATTLDR